MSRFVYVGTYTAPNTAPGAARPSTAAGITVFRMDGTTGALAPVQVVGGIENPSWLALDDQLTAMYATSEVLRWNGRQATGGVTAYAVDPATGYLTATNSECSHGALPAHAIASPTGRHVLVANYQGANFVVLPVARDGGLKPATDVFGVTGQGPNHDRQSGPHPHQVVFDRAAAFVHGLGMGADRIWTWRLDEDLGVLVPNDPPETPVVAGFGPRHLAFHPSGRFAYIAGELACAVTACAYDQASGMFHWLQTVSTLPAGIVTPSSCAEIAVHPDGRFVYVSNRGCDSITGFAVDQATGRLELIDWTQTLGETPRAFSLDPGGGLLLVGNQNSDTIVPFSVDRDTGRLTPTGHVTSTPTPVCIQFGPAEYAL
jgi:6-phosphogluconolactonase